MFGACLERRIRGLRQNWEGSGGDCVLYLLQKGRAFILNLADPLEQCLEIL